MVELLIQTFLGWPAMILSLGLALAGIVLKRSSLSLISALFFVAPAWYLSNYSIFLGSLPFFLLLSAQAISRNKILLAALAILPVLLVMGALGYVVINQ
jgi:hypothetical protein